jgi:hypothetical protein
VGWWMGTCGYRTIELNSMQRTGGCDISNNLGSPEHQPHLDGKVCKGGGVAGGLKIDAGMRLNRGEAGWGRGWAFTQTSCPPWKTAPGTHAAFDTHAAFRAPRPPTPPPHPSHTPNTHAHTDAHAHTHRRPTPILPPCCPHPAGSHTCRNCFSSSSTSRAENVGSQPLMLKTGWDATALHCGRGGTRKQNGCCKKQGKEVWGA